MVSDPFTDQSGMSVWYVSLVLTLSPRKDIIKISFVAPFWRLLVMQTAPGRPNQIPFRYRLTDSPTGITRDTAKRLAERSEW